MPFSSQNGKSYIDGVVARLPKPQRVLDVGAGSGTYSDRYRKQLGGHWTAVEIWKPYLTQYYLDQKYDAVVNQDIMEFVKEKHARFDVAFVGDILEHLPQHKAYHLIEQLVDICDYVIISIPIGYYPQDEYQGNPYEKHLHDNWTLGEALKFRNMIDGWTIQGEIGVFVCTLKGELPERKLKVVVYTIAKNEEKHVDRFMDTCAEADAVYVADTGSQDRTVELLRGRGAFVSEIVVNPWRFDVARNMGMDLVPHDVDIMVCIDLDEVLTPGWRAALERHYVPGFQKMRYRYVWNHHGPYPTGADGITFTYEKIHPRFGARWHKAVHEILDYTVSGPEITIPASEMVLHHWADNTKPRDYLPMLELTVKDDPTDDRNSHYLAREYMNYNRHAEAVLEFKRHLDLPKARWHLERCASMRYLGRCHKYLGDADQALDWFEAATREAPESREPWFELGRYLYETKNFLGCYHALRRALQIPNVDLQVYITEPEAWTGWSANICGVAAWELGLKIEAIDWFKEALKVEPSNKLMQDNLAICQKLLGAG